MQVSITGQAYVFLWSVLGGMLAAFIFDLFRLKRKTAGSGAVATFIEDLLFWILVAGIMLGVMAFTNDGEVRGYVFASAVIGAVLYSLLLSKIVMRAFMLAIGIIARAIAVLWLAVSFPFRMLFRMASVPAAAFANRGRRCFSTAVKILKMRAGGFSSSIRLFKRLSGKI